MKRIYLIRHGETTANKDGVFRGCNEIPLSEIGVEQARDLASYFDEIKIEKVFCSPLKRAVETAETAFPGGEIQPDGLINNVDHGTWTGVAKTEIQAKDPKRWHLWITEPEKLRFPGGEALSDLYNRAELFLIKLRELQFETVAVISHRSVIKSLLAGAVGIKESYFWRFHLDNASVSLLIYDENRGYTLAKLNDTQHLKSFVFEWA
ncbi:MAG: histidine phosphatase family protein [Proteobacteria bacterium]|nr:histidine phosphatase family protein [Pseudomonadota bacterium]